MMLPALLPPRGIFIPTQTIFHLKLPPSVLLTWIQLRSLAWDGCVTPPLRIQELTQITGKNQATLLNILSRLKSISSLDWCSTGNGRIIISFPDELSDKPKRSVDILNLPDFKVDNSETRKVPEPAFYFPAKILGYLSYQEDDDSEDNIK